MDLALLSINRIKTEIHYYRTLAADPAVPTVSRWLLLGALAYLVSPIDLIPDFIPVLGQLDDLIIVPGLVALAMLLIPAEAKSKARCECEK